MPRRDGGGDRVATPSRSAGSSRDPEVRTPSGPGRSGAGRLHRLGPRVQVSRRGPLSRPVGRVRNLDLDQRLAAREQHGEDGALRPFSGSPRLLKGGIVLLDPETARVRARDRPAVQPGHVTRTLQVQAHRRRGRRPLRGAAPEGRRRSRRSSSRPRSTPPTSSSSRTRPDARRARHSSAARRAGDDRLPDQRASSRRTTPWRRPGMIEIVPVEAPLTLFVWSKQPHPPRAAHRALSVTEEAFDPTSTRSAPRSASACGSSPSTTSASSHMGGSLFMVYLQQKERLARPPAPARSTPSASRGCACHDDRSGAVLAGGQLDRPLPAQPAATTASDTATCVPDGRPSSTSPPLRPPARPLRLELRTHGRRGRPARQPHRAATSATPSCSGGLCDANGAMRPDELIATLGRRLRITLPEASRGRPMAEALNLTLLIGPVVPCRPREAILDALTAVQVVTTARRQPGGFKLTFNLATSRRCTPCSCSPAGSAPIIRVVLGDDQRHARRARWTGSSSSSR